MSTSITPSEQKSVGLILGRVMDREWPSLITRVQQSDVANLVWNPDKNQAASAFLSWSENVDRAWLSDRILRSIESIVLVSRKAESPCVHLCFGGVYMTASHKLSLVAACSKRCFVLSSDGTESSYEYDGRHASDRRDISRDTWFFYEVHGRSRGLHKDIVSFVANVADASSDKE